MYNPDLFLVKSNIWGLSYLRKPNYGVRIVGDASGFIASHLKGELHIADVKTDQAYVLEFQHSPITTGERQSREKFYEKMVWVVDVTKRKGDKAKFLSLLNKAVRVVPSQPILKLSGYLDECALIRDWAGSRVPVAFDFGDEEGLWYLFPISTVALGYVVHFRIEDFIKLHSGGVCMSENLKFWFNDLSMLVSSLVQAQSRRSHERSPLASRRERRFRF